MRPIPATIKILAVRPKNGYRQVMDTVNLDAGQPAGPDTDAGRQARIAWEAEGIAEARADVAAGRLVDAAKVRAWADSLRTANPLPVPYSGR